MYLHLGPHKTATTSIQFALREAHDWLLERGMVEYSVHSPERGLYRSLRLELIHIRNSVLFGKKRDIGKAKELAREINGIISDENLIGAPIGQCIGRRYRETVFYPKAALIARILQEVFDRNVIPILCKRSSGLKWSLYANAIKTGSFKGPIDEFDVDWESIDFDRLGSDLSLAFDAEIRWLHFDEITNGSFDQFWRALDLSDAPPVKLGHMNASVRGLRALQK